jgi:NAD(P)-dependent dehydrogenase (short-subunit alcohol dehydrogenase family)
MEKVILITGAGRGLGRKLAGELAARGAIIAANDITPINVDEIVDLIIGRGGRAKSYIADVSKKIPVQAMINEIIDDWGRIDVLVNHANVKPVKPILDMDEWDWRRTMDVNLTGAFLVMQSVGRVMKAQAQGMIVNIIDNAERSSSIAHMASMQALAVLSQAASDELSTYNILCHTINLEPGKNRDEIIEFILTTFDL